MTATDTERRDIGLAREFLRKQIGLTQAQLGAKAGLSGRLVRRAEAGAPMNERVLRSIADALGCDFALYADGRVEVAREPQPVVESAR